MKTRSEQFLRRRKFLLVLPILVLPFITLAFWALGGGSGDSVASQERSGLNRELPQANISGEPLDKMSLYNQAAKDSLSLQEQMKADPYTARDTALFDGGTYGQDTQQDYPSYTRSYADPNEARVRAKLAQLERTLNDPGEETSDPYSARYQSTGTDLEKLQAMMQSMTAGGGNDPEMQQINSMLEAIMDIQNPGRVQEKLKQASQKNRGRVYAVGKPPEQNGSDLLQAGNRNSHVQQSNSNSFYDLAGSSSADTVIQTAIGAVVHETQVLVAGTSVKMKLSEDIFVNGQRIPAGTFISGICTINGERLSIDINNIRYGKSLFPVALSVYDLDGIEGIRIPGAINRDAAKEGADRTLQSMQFMSLDPSLGAQAAGAGVEVAKGLFGKKAKLVRVTVKAGHPLLLMDTKMRQEQN